MAPVEALLKPAALARRDASDAPKTIAFRIVRGRVSLAFSVDFCYQKFRLVLM
jgi:hypothetical protein